MSLPPFSSRRNPAVKPIPPINGSNRQASVVTAPPVAGVAALSPSTPPAPLSRRSPLQPLAFAMLAIYILVTYGRLAELVSLVVERPVPLALIAAGLAFFGLLISGGAMVRTMLSPLGRLMILYTGWLMITIPLGVWRSGSLLVFRQFWVTSVLAFVFVGSLIFDPRQLRKSILLMVMATTIIILASPYLGTDIGGRLGFTEGTLRNSNELSIHILLALPLCLFFVADRRSPYRTRILALGCAVGTLAVALLTGSRTGLLMMVICALAIFWISSIANKFKIILVFAAVGSLVLALLPDELRVRYATLFSNGDESHYVDAAKQEIILSAEGATMLRERLLQHSVRVALEHPLFGVGMGNFAPVVGTESAKIDAWNSGQYVGWRQPHNAYTQIAAETGFPGLILYLAILLLSFRICWRVRKVTRGQPALAMQNRLAGCLSLTLLLFAVSNLFATTAYSFYLPIYAALAQVLDRFADQPMSPKLVAPQPRVFPPLAAWSPKSATGAGVAGRSSSRRLPLSR